MSGTVLLRPCRASIARGLVFSSSLVRIEALSYNSPRRLPGMVYPDQRTFATKSGASSGRASRTEVIPDRVVNHAYVTGGHAGRYMPGFSFPA